MKFCVNSLGEGVRWRQLDNFEVQVGWLRSEAESRLNDRGCRVTLGLRDSYGRSTVFYIANGASALEFEPSANKRRKAVGTESLEARQATFGKRFEKLSLE